MDYEHDDLRDELEHVCDWSRDTARRSRHGNCDHLIEDEGRCDVDFRFHGYHDDRHGDHREDYVLYHDEGFNDQENDLNHGNHDQ